MAKRTGLKRKTIKQIVKSRPIAKRTGLKRKTIRIPKKKTYINTLNAEKVTLKKYLNALVEKERRDKEWQKTLDKANELYSLMEYEPVYSNKYPVIDLSLQDARNYELGFVNRRMVMFEKFSSFVNLFRRRMRSKRKLMGNCFCHHRCCYYRR